MIFNILRKKTAGEDACQSWPFQAGGSLEAEEEQEYDMHRLGVASIALN